MDKADRATIGELIERMVGGYISFARVVGNTLLIDTRHEDESGFSIYRHHHFDLDFQSSTPTTRSEE